MKVLIYELFSGVGFFNQLFSLETAVYLANISKRKLILIIKCPLCHCGQASWSHGDFISFFPQLNTLLPNGIEIYKQNIPPNLFDKIKNAKRNLFGERLSHLAIVDKVIIELFGESSEYIKNFIGHRRLVIFDVNTWIDEYIYINESNASRCLSTFLTTNKNNYIMTNICEVLSKYEVKPSIGSIPEKYISIHFRFGDVRWDTKHINNVQKNYNDNILSILNNLNADNLPLMIMCDRKDADILKILQEKYKILFTEDYVDKSYKTVESFLSQKRICENGIEFIGYYNSTVSHHIHYSRYIKNNSSKMYMVNKSECLESSINNVFSWNINKVNGASISWSMFFSDILKTVKSSKYYVHIINEKLVEKSNKKVISFCLYGINNIRDEKRNFLKGVYVNYELMKTIYPDWILRLYVPISEPIEYIQPFFDIENMEVIIVDTNICLRALRFLPYDDPDVDIWLSRDLDSVVNLREQVAVDDWLKGNKTLHVMADNHQHGWAIAGGMFGMKNDYRINFIDEVVKLSENQIDQNTFAIDCLITEKLFYNNYEDSYIQHYSAGTKLTNSIPFPPHKPIPSKFVGNISDIDKYFKELKLDKKYTLTNKIRLFNLDLHISVIEDIKYIFDTLCTNVEITDWSISGHTWVFNKSKMNVDHINSDTWRNINMEMIYKFQDKYDEMLKKYDGFIVTHTPVFCLLFEKYDKPIYLVNSCRYVQPYCWNKNYDMLKILDDSLKRMWDNKQLIAISNNKADQRFLELGTKIKSHHIPSLCLYTNSKYNCNSNKVIVMGTTRKDILPKIDNVVYKDDLRGRYKWEDLYKYKAIILLPYEVSTMSLFEYYSANVPLFIPSKDFFKSLILTRKYPCIGSRYFNYQPPKCFDEAIDGYPGEKFLNFWLNKADYYDSNNMPHIIYFSSFDELQNLILSTDYKLVSGNMKLFNVSRKTNVYNNHKELISQHFPGIKYREMEHNTLKQGVKCGYSRNQKQIEEYIHSNVNKEMVFLEIGPGGGQWSREIYSDVLHLHCVDIVSADDNNFYNYVPETDKITYHHVRNNNLSCIKDNSLDYVFTYDTFCYLTYDEIKMYMVSLKKKCKKGAKLLISYGDIYKFTSNEPQRIKGFEKEYNIYDNNDLLKKKMSEYYNGPKVKGKWAWLGINRFCDLVKNLGYMVINKDLDIDKTNPLTLLEV